VESRRGAEGGYRLARPASQINVAEVLRFSEAAKKPKRKAPDAFTDMWTQVDSAVGAILDHTTFADLARRWSESQARYVPNWQI
jgi:DNA-binding IscR family transcriptional regulator